MHTTKGTIQPCFLMPNPDQPRKVFDQEAIKELAASIMANGMIQPIAVVKLHDFKEAFAKRLRLPDDVKEMAHPDAHHMIVAGERRWRAACLIAREQPTYRAPILVYDDLTEQQIFELSLVENVNRQDMLPMEEANAFGRLRNEYGLSTGEIARKMGRSADFVRGRLALLDLDPDIQALVNGGHIPITVAISISRLSGDRQHQVVKLLNEEGLNAMEACFLADKLYSEQEQGELFNLATYFQERAAEATAKWLSQAQTVTEKVKDALTHAVEQLGLPDLEAHAAQVQERIESLLHPKPGEFETCPACVYYGSCHKEGDEPLDGEACFEEAPPTLEELVEYEVQKEKDINTIIAERTGRKVTDQVRVFVLKVETPEMPEPEQDHFLLVVVKRGPDILLTMQVAEQVEGTASVYVDADYGVGDPRWEGVKVGMEADHRYYEGGTLLYREDGDG